MSRAARDKRKRDKRERGRERGLATADKARKAQKGGPRFKMAKTANGQRIQQMLIRVGWNPADYKDYVVIIGTRLIDWADSYNVTNNEGKPVREGSEAIVLHKSKLHEAIPERVADLFWNKRLGTRVIKDGPPPPPTRREKLKDKPRRRRAPPEPEEAEA